MSRLAGFEMQDITLVNLADCDTPEEYIEQVSRLPRLQTLVVGGQSFRDENVGRMKALKTLRWLVLDSTPVTDEAIAAMERSVPTVTVHRSDRRHIRALMGEPNRGVQTVQSNAHLDLQRLLAPEFFWQIDNIYARNDGEIARLSVLSTIRSVVVDAEGGIPITPEGLARLSRIKGLEGVGFWHIRLSDAIVAQLAQLKAPRWVALNNFRQFDDAELAKLRNLKTITWLNASNKNVTDAGLPHIATLENLEGLGLTESNITDAGLAALAKLKKLRELSLSSTTIRGIGLSKLPPTLSELDLSNTNLCDDGLARLPPLSNIEKLCLAKTAVTDAGLAHLAKLERLAALDLWQTHIHDEGLPHLAKIRSLTSLSLADTRITDAGLANLASLPNLESLDITDTDLTDAALLHLVRIKKLKRISFSGTKINAQAAATVLPQCELE